MAGACRKTTPKRCSFIAAPRTKAIQMSQVKLGAMYDTGSGVPQDDAEAVKWYRRAADHGDVLPSSMLGVMYDDGRGVPQDYAEALKWYRRAADQGDAAAQYSLGFAYASGQGVLQDFTEARQWYRRAAD